MSSGSAGRRGPAQRATLPTVRRSVLPRHLAAGPASRAASRPGAARYALRTRVAGRRRLLFALALACLALLVAVPMLTGLSDSPAHGGRTGDDGVFSDGTERGTGGQGGPVLGTESSPTTATAPGGVTDPAGGVPAGDLTGVGGDAALPGAAAGGAGTAGAGTAGTGGAAVAGAPVGGGTAPGGAAVAGPAGPGTAPTGGTSGGTSGGYAGGTSGGSSGGSTGGTSGGSTGTSSGGTSSGGSSKTTTSSGSGSTSTKRTTETKDSDSDSDCLCKELGETVDETTETLKETVEEAEGVLPSLP